MYDNSGNIMYDNSGNNIKYKLTIIDLSDNSGNTYIFI